ncbi:arginase family protein, partial [Mesorhizobium sp. M0644]|uniref:arginase family protein n=1 Tax=Mesorhizobium sp. M0644 TaxID=2956979 RepID=UPI00333A3EB3
MHCTIVGAPIQAGSGRMGCEMGPSALRTAGLAGALTELGHTLTDLGTIVPADMRPVVHGNAAVKALPEIAAWTAAISETAYAASADAMPIFLGGDHSISAGTLAGIARRGGPGGPGGVWGGGGGGPAVYDGGDRARRAVSVVGRG